MVNQFIDGNCKASLLTAVLAEVLPGVLFVRGLQREFEDLLAVLIFSPVRWALKGCRLTPWEVGKCRFIYKKPGMLCDMSGWYLTEFEFTYFLPKRFLSIALTSFGISVSLLPKTLWTPASSMAKPKRNHRAPQSHWMPG